MESQLYSTLGKLFYGVACMDKRLHQEEVERFEEALKRYWSFTVTDSDSIENEIMLISRGFTEAAENRLSGESCLESFKKYFTSNNILFTREIREKIFKIANSIANSVAGRNKAELIYLAKLKLLMDSAPSL
jgi:hypothetical protein